MRVWGTLGRGWRFRFARLIEILTIIPSQRPYENHFLVTSPTHLARMPKKLQSLLGYSVCTPLVGRVNGSHPLKALQHNDDGSAAIKYAKRLEDGGEARL